MAYLLNNLYPACVSDSRARHQRWIRFFDESRYVMDAWASAALGLALCLAGTCVAWLTSHRRQRQASDAFSAVADRDLAAIAEVLEGTRRDLEAAQVINRVYVEETRHLVDHRLPAHVELARDTAGVTLPGLAHPDLAGGALAAAHEALLESVVAAIGTCREDISGTTRTTIRHALAEPQSRLVRLLNQIDAELGVHKDRPEAVASLMRIDPHASASLHGLQRLRILCGDTPGVQRSTSQILDMVEAAQGRIEAHDQINYLHNPKTGGAWVTGRLVEPVVLALAELFANATSHSTRPADVTVHDGAAGYAIVVDDRGIGMNDEQREHANAVLSSTDPVDVTRSEDALRLGFPVIAMLAARYDFTVEVAGRSIFGGNRTALLIPMHHIAAGPDTDGYEPTAARLANPPMTRTGATAFLPGASAAVPVSAQRTASGLPVRDRTPPTPQRTGPVHLDPGLLDADALEKGLSNIADAFNNTDDGDPR